MGGWGKSPRSEHPARGFTLVELVVVVALLGILVGIVTSAVLWAADRARQVATMADMRNLAAAITAYSVDHGSPPGSNGGYLEIVSYLEVYHFNLAVPRNDHWLNTYGYTSTGVGYSLISFGKDGIDGPDLTWEERFEFERDIILVNGRFHYGSDSSPGPNDKKDKGKHLGEDHGTGKPDDVPGGGG